MITKKELTDLTIERLNGGPVLDYRKYHPNVIGRMVDVVLNSIISQDIAMAEQTGGDVSSEWIQTLHNIPIKWDSTTERCYIQWEKEILMMKDNRGIREIGWPATEMDRGFNIMPGSSYQVLADLEAADPENGLLALIYGNRVYFPTMPKRYVKDKRKITARVVLAAAAYESEDILPVPEERFIEAMAAIDQITSPFKLTRMKTSNDSNPNTL